MISLIMPLMAGMGLLQPFVLLLFFCAAASLLWWGFSKLTIPEPFKTLLMVVIGLVAIFVLWQIVAPMLGSG